MHKDDFLDQYFHTAYEERNHTLNSSQRIVTNQKKQKKQKKSQPKLKIFKPKVSLNHTNPHEVVLLELESTSQKRPKAWAKWVQLRNDYLRKLVEIVDRVSSSIETINPAVCKSHTIMLLVAMRKISLKVLESYEDVLDTSQPAPDDMASYVCDMGNSLNWLSKPPFSTWMGVSLVMNPLICVYRLDGQSAVLPGPSSPYTAPELLQSEDEVLTCMRYGSMIFDLMKKRLPKSEYEGTARMGEEMDIVLLDSSNAVVERSGKGHILQYVPKELIKSRASGPLIPDGDLSTSTDISCLSTWEGVQDIELQSPWVHNTLVFQGQDWLRSSAEDNVSHLHSRNNFISISSSNQLLSAPSSPTRGNPSDASDVSQGLNGREELDRSLPRLGSRRGGGSVNSAGAYAGDIATRLASIDVEKAKYDLFDTKMASRAGVTPGQVVSLGHRMAAIEKLRHESVIDIVRHKRRQTAPYVIDRFHVTDSMLAVSLSDSRIHRPQGCAVPILAPVNMAK